jgi:hypothetical protein
VFGDNILAGGEAGHEVSQLTQLGDYAVAPFLQCVDLEASSRLPSLGVCCRVGHDLVSLLARSAHDVLSLAAGTG